MIGGKKRKSMNVETLIGQNTEITGDIHFSGGLHIDGVIKGSVIAAEDTASVLRLSEFGRIEGEVKVPTINLNGTVNGDVYASQGIELASKARVNGNVYYQLIEMAMGAEVNGNLVHKSEVNQKVTSNPVRKKAVLPKEKLVKES